MSVTTAAGAKVYQEPGEAGSPVELKPRYENFVGGHWVQPVHGEYMKDLSPANARQFTEVPRSTKEDMAADIPLLAVTTFKGEPSS